VLQVYVLDQLLNKYDSLHLKSWVQQSAQLLRVLA